MTQSKTMALLDALLQATSHGEVRWEDTASEDVFRTWIGDGGVKIGEALHADEDESVFGRKTYTAWVLNPKDEVVDQIELGPTAAGYSVLEGLFTLARRNARNADDVVDNMLSALKSRK
jgi:hypothetical protein